MLRLRHAMLVSAAMGLGAPALADQATAEVAATATPITEAGAEGTEVDSEIVVTAPITRDRVQPPIIQIGPEELLIRQPTTIADSLQGLSGVSVKTNSRGDTIARVRGAEERQTAVFLDGAPLNVPWDGRVDLGVLPAGLIGNVRVTKGAVPIEFGANAVAGVVDLQTRRGGGRDGEAGSFTGLLEGGTLGLVNASGVASVEGQHADVTMAGGYIRREAERVSDTDRLPFSQDPDSKRRTNTDLESFSLYGSAGTRLGILEARASLLHNESRRGIAPESDRDPAVAAPRYWRYPDIDLTQLTLNARVAPSDDVSVTGVFYRQWFAQQILAYRDETYTRLRTTEDDEDDTVGGRLTLAAGVGPIDLRISGSHQRSTHRQVDTTIPNAPGPKLKYRQELSSIGAEGDIRLAARSRLTLGVAYDRSESPLTGDKPDQPDIDAFAFSAAFRQELSDQMTLTVSGGRRTRFASLRELFGEALGRFLINPDLKPERAWLADAELAYVGEGFRFVVNPFYANGDDTIAQRAVRVGGVSLRQRFNLTGTESYGVDANMTAQLAPGLSFDLNGTYLVAKAEPGDAAFRRLLQRPRYEVTALLDYRFNDVFNVRGEVRQTGKAVDLDEFGAREVLPSSTEFSARASLTVLRLGNGNRLSLTLAGDNLTNEFVLPQAGLPAPGRTIRVGLRFD